MPFWRRGRATAPVLLPEAQVGDVGLMRPQAPPLDQYYRLAMYGLADADYYTATLLAEAKARAKLLTFLTSYQRKTLKENGWFEVMSNTGKRWRISSKSRSHNTVCLEWDGTSVCVHIKDSRIPLSDNLLAQALLIRTDEEKFLRYYGYGALF